VIVGGLNVNTRKMVRLFTRTLLLGAIVTTIVSFFVKTSSYSQNLNPIDLWEISGVFIWFIGVGLLFGVVSQTGFFAYLIVNQIGLNIFKGFWKTVQLVLIAFALFDLVYFPYKAAGEGASIVPYIVTALVILLFGLVVSFQKAKETNKSAFVPALFFMVVITIIEWVPVLRTQDGDWMLLMIAPLLACNTYQLLVLHKLTKMTPEEAARLEERRKALDEKIRKKRELKRQKKEDKRKKK
jgi:KinB signaling pathway activation protein